MNDGTYYTAQIPSVPDWNAGGALPTGNSITLAATLNHRDTGTTATQDLAHPVYLYHLHIPTNRQPSDPNVIGITLPNLGTTFTGSCTTPALHVFAISAS